MVRSKCPILFWKPKFRYVSICQLCSGATNIKDYFSARTQQRGSIREGEATMKIVIVDIEDPFAYVHKSHIDSHICSHFNLICFVFEKQSSLDNTSDLLTKLRFLVTVLVNKRINDLIITPEIGVICRYSILSYYKLVLIKLF